MQIPKREPYRNRKLLDLAHEIKTCQFRSPICKGYQGHGCEPIHSDFHEHGKGGSQKADDDQFVIGCHPCHEWFGAKKVPRNVLFRMFEEGRKRSFELLEKLKLLEKVGYDRNRRN